MKKGLLVLLVSVVSFYCDISTTAEAQDRSKIPTISARVAYKNFQSGKGIIVEAMSPESYEKGHLLGAINIPSNGPGDVAALREMDLQIAKDQDIYVYCG
jgi:rhodanese-related sulfurtransferase